MDINVKNDNGDVVQLGRKWLAIYLIAERMKTISNLSLKSAVALASQTYSIGESTLYRAWYKFRDSKEVMYTSQRGKHAKATNLS